MSSADLATRLPRAATTRPPPKKACAPATDPSPSPPICEAAAPHACIHGRPAICDARSERRYSTARGRQSRVRPAYVSASRDAGTVALSCSRHHSTGMTHGPTASVPRSSCSASRVIAAKDEWLVVEWGPSIRAAGWLRAPKTPCARNTLSLWRSPAMTWVLRSCGRSSLSPGLLASWSVKA